MSNLTNVKVDDKLVLFYSDGLSSRSARYVIVSRLTPTLVYIAGSDRAYMRHSGRERGGSEYHADWLEAVTPENRRAVAASVREAEVRRAFAELSNNLGHLSGDRIIILRDQVRAWLADERPIISAPAENKAVQP